MAAYRCRVLTKLDKKPWVSIPPSAAIVEALLAAPGIQIDLPDRNGDTPLHLATRKRNKLAVAALLAAGADITIKNRNLETALDIITPPPGVLEILRMLEQAKKEKTHEEEGLRPTTNHVDTLAASRAAQEPSSGQLL